MQNIAATWQPNPISQDFTVISNGKYPIFLEVAGILVPRFTLLLLACAINSLNN